MYHATAGLFSMMLILTHLQTPANLSTSLSKNLTRQHNGEAYKIVLTDTLREELPQFPGGEEAMMDFIKKNLNYPKAARKKRIEGLVYVKFIVRANGKVEEAEILRKHEGRELLEEEAIRMVLSMPAWKPGHQGGKPVDVSFTLPLRFTLK
jgi:TonB family protein